MGKNSNMVEVRIGNNTFNITKEHSQRLMKDMIEETAPPKPIKRKEKFSQKDRDELMALLKKARPLFSKAVEAFDNVNVLDFERLTKDDEEWLEKYTSRLGDIFNYVNNNLDAGFY